MITSGHYEGMAAWSANQAKLAWVTNRNGPWQIWVRGADGSERPVVTAADFPTGVEHFMAPSPSPNGDRIIYVATGTGMNDRLWISSLAGGVPVRLTATETGEEVGGSWSPDASSFAYLRDQNGVRTLMIVKTSGNTTPVVLKERVRGYLPDWSPTGEWITYRDRNGWWLISPDGKTSKSLGKIETRYLAFSKDGKLLYGIETSEVGGQPDRATLFSLDPSTLKRTVIKELGKELAPQSRFLPSFRFSLAPDGKSFVYPTAYYREDLWMLTGYRQPGWRARIADLFGPKQGQAR